MKINMNFTDNGQTFPVQMQENSRRLDASVGEYQVVGVPGADGAPGADGFSPVVELTETDTGVDIRVTDAGGVKTATVRNGRDGRDGVDGKDGKDGKDGQTGPQGPAGSAGPVGPQGPQGPQGPAGADGKAGQDGRTPVKGTDYFTAADKAELVTAVVAALPVYGGETA